MSTKTKNILEFREITATWSLLYEGSRRATIAKQPIFKNFRLSVIEVKKESARYKQYFLYSILKFEHQVTTYLCSGYVLTYGPHCTTRYATAHGYAKETVFSTFQQ